MTSVHDGIIAEAHMDALVARRADEGLGRLCAIRGEHEAVIVNPLDTLRHGCRIVVVCHTRNLLSAVIRTACSLASSAEGPA